MNKKKKVKQQTQQKQPQQDQKFEWQELNEKIQVGKSQQERTHLYQLFKQFDISSNGYLSLADIETGLLPYLHPLIKNIEIKPACMRAFRIAKTAKTHRKRQHDEDYLELFEFRIFLIYVRQYMENWKMFQRIDSSGDNKIQLAEFRRAVPLLARWGVEIKDPVKTFKEIDKNKGGVLLFDEWCDWAIKKQLTLEDDDYSDQEQEVQQEIMRTSLEHLENKKSNRNQEFGEIRS